jgi:hypothetical protein
VIAHGLTAVLATEKIERVPRNQVALSRHHLFTRLQDAMASG